MDFINQYNPRFAKLCVQFASIVFLYYDYALTLPSEIKYIWLGKVRHTTFLYVGCRFALIGNVVFLLTLFNILDNPKNWLYFVTALSILGRFCILAIWTLRTWAIWHRQWWILFLLVPWALTCVGLDILSSTPFGTEASDHALTLLYLTHEWVSVLLASYQCVRTIWNRRDLDFDSVSMKKNISFQVFWEGIFYILCISTFTLTDAVLQFRSPEGSFQKKVLTAYTLPISGLLTARFILHMRSQDTVDRYDTTYNNNMTQTLSDPVLSGLVIHCRGGEEEDLFDDEEYPPHNKNHMRRRDPYYYGGGRQVRRHVAQHSMSNNDVALGQDLERTVTNDTYRTYVHSDGSTSGQRPSGEEEKVKVVGKELGTGHRRTFTDGTMHSLSETLKGPPSPRNSIHNDSEKAYGNDV